MKEKLVFGLKNPFKKTTQPAPVKTLTHQEKAVTISGDTDLPTFDAAVRERIWNNVFANYLSIQNTPHWQQLRGFQSVMDWYGHNPVFNAVVNIKARESGNMKYKVLDLETDKAEPMNSKHAEVRAIYTRLENPNCMQNRMEFQQQKKIFSEVLGNTMTYANAPIGFGITIETIQALFNVWPQYMEFKLAGNYFDATEVKDIIKKWQFVFGSYKKEFEPHEILLSNRPNVDIKDGLIFGRPIAQSLVKPLTNIDMAYESRNVMMRNRGMRVIMSSNKTDASGSIPLQPNEKQDVQDAIKGYGMLEGQKQFFFTDQPINTTVVDQDVRKLGLLEEVASDAMLVCHQFGVPEILLKLYLSGATFENQVESVRRLYQGALIPESENEIISLNKFLGLTGTRWMIQGSFDHIPGLQRSEKEKASSNKETSSYMKDLFLAGAATHNQWLQSVGLEAYDGGDKRIFEFGDREVAIILNKLVIQSEGQQQQGQGNGQEQTPPPPKMLNGKHVVVLEN